MGFIKQVSLASVAAIAITSAAFAQDKPSADMVLATVNGTEITLGHLVSIASNLGEEYSRVPADQLYNGILDQLVQQALLEETSPISENRLKYVFENERRAMASSVAIEKIAEAAATNEAVQALYESKIASQEPSPEFHASHILVDTEEAANEIMKMLEGGADFATLAKEKSTGPSGPSGGDLGWFGPGAMVPEFDQAVAGMKVGEYVGPVKTQFGYHLIILNDKRDYPTLDSQRQELVEELGSTAIGAEIARLEAAAKIEKPSPMFNLELIRDSSIVE